MYRFVCRTRHLKQCALGYATRKKGNLPINAGRLVHVKPLLQWVSEYAVRTYPTPDSGLTYLIHARIAQTTPSFAL